jgi:thiol-disulfide isomerase/thioredoxin
MHSIRKKMLTGLACLLSTAIVFAAGPVKDSLVVLKGQMPKSYEESKIYIFYSTERGRVKDSAVVHNGSFEIKNYIHHPCKASVSVAKPGETGVRIDNIFKTVYLEPGFTFTVTAGDNWKEATISGGPIQTDWRILEKMIDSTWTAIGIAETEKWNKSRAHDPEGTKIAEAKEQFLQIRLHQLQDQFISAHPASFVSFDVVQGRSGWIDSDDGLKTAFDRLASKFKNTPEGKATEMRILGSLNAGIGKIAPDFVCMDTLGNPVKLSSLRGKYLMVDFWASWCGFCRAENPNLLEAYKKYKDKNFDIVSVSYDDSKDKWMKAIHEDKMPWQQISELKDMLNAPSAKEYGLSGIPMIILLDPSGRIIAKNLRGEALQRKLAEVLGAPAGLIHS